MTCPLCREPIRPGQPVALVGHDGPVRVIHLVPCGALLLALNDVLRTADALGTTPSTN